MYDTDINSSDTASQGLVPPSTGHVPAKTNSGLFTGEVAGDTLPSSVGTESQAEASPHAEAVSPFPGSESDAEAGDTAEASPAELAAESSSEESAFGDLMNVPGFERRESGEEGQAEFLPEAGGENAQEEFFPLLAGLIPALVSTAGPALAKGVFKKLSPRVKKIVQKAPRVAAPVLGRSPQALLDLLKSLLNAKMSESTPGGESSELEADPEFAGAVASAMEVIIGRDDRVRLTSTTDVPWRRLCALRITFPSGATYRGTGFLIGRRAVATAGHCVHLANQGGWARSVEVIPGANDAQRPFGGVASSSFRSVAGWVSQRKPECDYGCIVLPAGAFNNHNLGAFGFAAFSPQDLKAQPAVLAGYPGDKPFAQLWGMARKIKRVNAKTLVYDMDSMGGQSGSPVYIKRNGIRYVVGIHNYGDQQGNSATRITPDVYNVLKVWSQI